jgi:hypothetical protein
MAIIVYTARPKALLSALVTAVDEGEAGDWERDSAGDFFLASKAAKRAGGEGWFRPEARDGALDFSFLVTDGRTVTEAMHAAHHAQLVQTLLSSFGEHFSAVTATAMQEEEEEDDGYEPEEAADDDDE